MVTNLTLIAIGFFSSIACLVAGYLRGYDEGRKHGYRKGKQIYDIESEYEWDFRKAKDELMKKRALKPVAEFKVKTIDGSGATLCNVDYDDTVTFEMFGNGNLKAVNGCLNDTDPSLDKTDFGFNDKEVKI